MGSGKTTTFGATITIWQDPLANDFIPTYSFCSYPPFMALNGL